MSSDFEQLERLIGEMRSSLEGRADRLDKHFGGLQEALERVESRMKSVETALHANTMRITAAQITSTEHEQWAFEAKQDSASFARRLFKLERDVDELKTGRAK